MSFWVKGDEMMPIDKVDSFEKKAFTDLCSTSLFLSLRGDKKEV